MLNASLSNSEPWDEDGHVARTDDENRRRVVYSAREIIYKKNYAVNSKPVEALLKQESLVPTEVGTNMTSAYKFIS